MKNYLNAVIYARFSSDRQQESSIAVQVKECMKYCEANHIQVIEVYKDEARTGTDGEREEFQRMLAEAPLGRFNLVIIHRWDRFARNVELALAAKKEFEAYGIKVVSVVEDFDDTPEGEFFNLVSLGIAALYSKRLSRESFNGQIENARQGKAHSGTPLYGYEVVNKSYRIVPKEAEAIRIMFRMVADGHTYRETVNYLNEQGYRRRDGRPLSYFITDQLQNRQYMGEYVFNQYKHIKIPKRGRSILKKSESEIIRIPNGIPAIVDKETFERVQEILKNRKTVKRQNKKKGKYLLTGLITCGICGSAVCGGQKTVRGMPFCDYRCGSKEPHEHKAQIKVVLMDKYIVNLFTRAFLLQKNSDKVCELLHGCITAIREKRLSEIKNLRQIYDEVCHTVAGLEEIIRKNKGKAIATVLCNDLEAERRKQYEMESKIEHWQSENSKLPRINTDTVRKQALKFKSILESTDFYAKQELLHILVKGIIMSADTVETVIRLNVLAGITLPLECKVIEKRLKVSSVYDLCGLEFELDKMTITI